MNGPKLFWRSGIKEVDDTKTERDPKTLQRWKEGRTANAFVNANMIELAKTGWMSNRGRQNVASLLILDLGQDWLAGAKHFENLLSITIHAVIMGTGCTCGVVEMIPPGPCLQSRKTGRILRPRRKEFRTLWLS